MPSRKDEKRPAPAPTLLPSPVSTNEYTDIGQLPNAEDDAPLADAPLELAPLKPESERALRRLARYKPPRDRWPMRRRAAVLVALFGGRHGVRRLLRY
jgi:hypothetical protein